MADKVPTLDREAGGGDGSVLLWTWANLVAASLAGVAVKFPEWADCCVQIIANTAGGATCTIQGSNDGTNWGTLYNVQGTTLVVTATTAPKQIVERPLFFRPILSGGGGTEDWTVILLLRRAQPLRV